MGLWLGVKLRIILWRKIRVIENIARISMEKHKDYQKRVLSSEAKRELLNEVEHVYKRERQRGRRVVRLAGRRRVPDRRATTLCLDGAVGK